MLVCSKVICFFIDSSGQIVMCSDSCESVAHAKWQPTPLLTHCSFLSSRPLTGVARLAEALLVSPPSFGIVSDSVVELPAAAFAAFTGAASRGLGDTISKGPEALFVSRRVSRLGVPPGVLPLSEVNTGGEDESD